MINNPKIGQKVWFLEPWGQCIHSAKITALGETEVSVRNPQKYPYAYKFFRRHPLFPPSSHSMSAYGYFSGFRTETSVSPSAVIKAKIKDASDLVAFMYDHCVACAEEYTDWTARKAVKEIAKEMLGLDLD